MQVVEGKNVATISRKSAIFEDSHLEELARQTGFMGRRSKQLTPLAFVRCMLHFVGRPKISFRIWASWITMTFSRVTKQAVWKRVNKKAVDFLKAVLLQQLANSSDAATIRSKGVFSAFSRVLVQDSTTLALPQKFTAAYPGSANQHASHAAMKIQLIYDLLTDVPIDFSLSSFRRNDQAAASDILELIKEGDLILRDLGYFVLRTFRKIHKAKAFFLSRFKFGTNLYKAEGDKDAFDLAKYLRDMKKKGVKTVDMALYIGSEERLPVRLVAVRVPDHIAAERKRKAKNNRDKSLKPGKDRLSMLNWEVFITNVDPSIWDTATVAEVYGFRWKIEMVFKVWKSYFSLPDVPGSCSEDQLHCLIYARLIFASIYHYGIWTCSRNKLNNPDERIWISPFRLASLVPLFIDEFLSLAVTGIITDQLKTILRDFATYEKRKRLSFEEITYYYLERFHEYSEHSKLQHVTS